MGLDEGRIADLQMLSQQRKYASPGNRAKIDRTMHNIQNESSLQRSMRQELIKASRNGDTARSKEIRENVAGIKKYNNE